MKYTRYDLKKSKKGNSVLAVILFSVLILAFIIGSFISNLFLKNIGTQSSADNHGGTSAVSVDKTVNKTKTFIAIQHGKFQKQESLEQAKKTLSDYCSAFNVKEQDGTRVIVGIYNEEDGMKVIKQLTDKNIDNSKISFTIQEGEDLCSQEISAVINAELEVINRLSDKTVKSYQTDELKKWCSGLQEVDSKSKNYTALNDLKTNVNSLPKDLTSDKVSDIEVYIYNLLKGISKK